MVVVAVMVGLGILVKVVRLVVLEVELSLDLVDLSLG